MGGRIPGAGQTQTDIDAEAARIEAEILGLPVPSAPAPSQQQSAPAPSRSRSKSPSSDQGLTLPPSREPAPRRSSSPGLGDSIGKAAVNVLQTLGNELVRGMFGTARRKRR